MLDSKPFNYIVYLAACQWVDGADENSGQSYSSMLATFNIMIMLHNKKNILLLGDLRIL